MPAVKSGRILVTGASGFIAVWCVERALKAGFEVVGSKRISTPTDSKQLTSC
jgi:nucleoside-diphosphate-sugar epimerase